jgi:hypothetical protein
VYLGFPVFASLGTVDIVASIDPAASDFGALAPLKVDRFGQLVVQRCASNPLQVLYPHRLAHISLKMRLCETFSHANFLKNRSFNLEHCYVQNKILNAEMPLPGGTISPCPDDQRGHWARGAEIISSAIANGRVLADIKPAGRIRVLE